MAESILVAHGSSDVRDLIEAALYEGGFECIPVENGKEALRSTVGLNPGVEGPIAAKNRREAVCVRR